MRRAVVLVALACHAAPAGPRVLDAFEGVSAWRASGSDGVTAAVRAVPGVRGQALELAFDLASTAGYAVARRSLALDLSGEFELAFELRGDLPINNLELKLIDASGENVWWYHRANYEFPKAWRHVVVKRRQIEFAWGPAADHGLGKIAAIELVVSTGRGGGKGTVAIDELTVRALPAVTAPVAPIAPGAPAIVDGDRATTWTGTTATIDLGRERDFAGLWLWWGARPAKAYTVELSRDGARWEPAARITGGDGGLDPLALPEASARYLRIAMPVAGELAEVALVEPEAATLDGFVTALARQLPRGSLPRGMTGEQPYWTVVGVDGGGGHASLLSEDGALELASGATIEPFVEVAGAPVSWATAPEISQALVDDYLPIPSVAWRAPGWELSVTAVATGEPAAPRLAARYTVTNRGAAPLALRLVLAIRPFQVNPPTQFLNLAGGVRKIGALAWQAGTLMIDGAPALRPDPPDVVALWPSPAIGYPVAPLIDARAAIRDPSGLASGALGYDLTLAPGEARSVVIGAPLAGEGFPTESFDAQLAAARAGWHARLDRVGFRVPTAGRAMIDTLRTSLAYMLISRDGPILRPGTRSYARAWIRDGAMIGEALLRLGHPDVAAAFLAWYAPYQFASGKVPCCVEPHGAVPVPEHDSHGELIHLAAELARYTGDRAGLRAIWPRVQAAAGYLEQLRQSERTPANRGRPAFGLLPPSISHEGYSAKPAYSYWDDFWGLVGLRDAAWIAGELGEDATALAAQRDAFQADLLASITASAAAHGVDYIPGAADLGDFDATSTTIALSPGNALAALPPALVHATFERAWRQLAARATTAWDAYTPYELRLIGSFARLGWRDRVQGGLAAYLGDRRPRGWNQWAEVVGRDARKPRFLGDMPHAWVCSDYARSVLDLFAYERGDGAWLLAAGVDPAWFAGRGFAIEQLATPFGPLSYAVTSTERAVTVQLDAGPVPAQLLFTWPFAAPPGATRINGKPARWRGTELLIPERPATIVIAKDP